MGSTLAFDNHAFVKQLVEAGMKEQQAEAIASGLSSINVAGVATKEDISNLQLELSQLETRLTNRLATFLGIAVAIQSVVIALLKLY